MNAFTAEITIPFNSNMNYYEFMYHLILSEIQTGRDKLSIKLKF